MTQILILNVALEHLILSLNVPSLFGLLYFDFRPIWIKIFTYFMALNDK